MTSRKLLACALLLLVHLAAQADDYPRKPIKVLFGFPAGGAPDTVLRRIAAALEPRLGQPVVVENRPGASGTIAAGLVAHAPADGYTLMLGVAANLAVAPALASRPAYDPPTAFTPIIEVARGPYVWLVPSKSPAGSMSQFLEMARRDPGKLNYASPGIGSVHFLATEAMQRSAGIRLTHIPYPGGMYPGMLGGQIDGMFDSLPTPLAHIRSGKLRALAVTGPKRLEALPDVPTLAEQGIADPQANSWWGFVGPAGLPSSVVARLNREIAGVLADPTVVAEMRQLGIEPSSGSAAAFGTYIREQYAHWRAEAKALSLNAD